MVSLFFSGIYYKSNSVGFFILEDKPPYTAIVMLTNLISITHPQPGGLSKGQQYTAQPHPDKSGDVQDGF
jgi:hypothetical protein